MDSIYLKTFLEVMMTGSFTRAAEVLCVTQSAVSRRIQFMETQYGCTLVDRSGSFLKPTSEGRLVMEKALKIIEIEKELDLGLSKFGKKQQFSFVCTPIFSLYHLPEILRKFLRSHPDLADLKFVSETPENIMDSMERGLYDIAVIEHCQDFDLSGFEAFDLPGDEIVFSAIPDLVTHSDENQLEKIFKHTFFSRKSGNCSRSLLEKNLSKTGYSLTDFPRVVVVDDLDTHLDLIVKGEGVAFISNDLIKSHVESGELVEIRIPDFVHKRRRTLVFSPHSTECSCFEAFADQILDHFKNSETGKSGFLHAV